MKATRSRRGDSRTELRARLSQQQAVARVGQLALTDVSAQDLFDETTRLVAAELRADFVSLLELLPDRDAFIQRSAVGWPPEQLNSELIPAGAHSQAGYTLTSSRPVVMDDAMREERFELSPRMAELGITSGISARVGSNGGSFGVINAHSLARREFSEHDVTFLEAIANVIASSVRRQKAEEETERAHRVLEAVIEGTTDSIFVKDLDGRYVTLNETAAKVLGLPREELLGHTLHELLPGENAEVMAESDELTLERGSVATFAEEVRVGDETRFFLATKGPYRAGDGTLLGTFGIAHDITDLKATEQELRAARDYADRLIETSNAIVLVLDCAGNIVTFNRAAEEITGYARDEVLGRSWSMLLPRERYPDPWHEFERLIAVGAPERYENPILTKSGEERVILWQNSRLRGEDGQTIGTVSFGIDVTETVDANRRAEQLEARLQQAEKLEALGQLAGGVAHDFNNLLLAIRGYGELALGRLEARDEPVAKNVERMIEASDRAAELTKQLLAFGRRQVLKPEVIDLNDVVRTTVALLTRLIGENVELVVLTAEPVTVDADRGQLGQVIANLAVNARDAMPGGGRLTISVSTAELPEREGTPFALLSVSDEGTGIDPAVVARIFEPFFTTKGDKGTGLGLPTVYGIVAQSGGEVRVDSEPGRGSTFSVYLPLSAGHVAEPAPAPAPQQVDGNETVLLVEDDPAVRTIVSTMLEAHGYHVATASGGEEAVEQFRMPGRRIDLVVSDLVMRGLDGQETIERIRKLEPATKALYMSGYTDDATIRKGELGAGTSFIQKPFTSEELAARVRQLLDRARV